MCFWNGCLNRNNELNFWTGNISTATAVLQIVEAMHLPRHFEVIAIHRVMPAFDIDGAFKAAHAQDGNDICPVQVAKPGGAVIGKLLGAADTKAVDDVPIDAGAFAVHMENFVCPITELGQRVNQLNHLVAGLPFEAEVFGGKGIKN